MINLEILLDNLIKRDLLPKYPKNQYSFKCASSHDPRAIDPKDVPNWNDYKNDLKQMGGWFANLDFSQFIRKEENKGRYEYVMLESMKPGIITWFWTGLPQPNLPNKGIIRIYFDNEENPTLEMLIEDFLNKGLCGDPLSIVLDQGRNLFLPICWEKSIKITYDLNYRVSNKLDEKLWYIIYYREYNDNIEIQSFTFEDLEKNKQKINEINQILDQSSSSTNINYNDDRINNNNKSEVISIEPKDSLTIENISGENSKTIEQIHLGIESNFNKSINNHDEVYRKIILEVEFDGKKTICTPISDFFGSGLGITPFNGWFRRITPDLQLVSNWIMPFKERCIIRLKNLNVFPVKMLKFPTKFNKWTWNEDSMYFHSNWHQKINIPTRPFRDFKYLEVQGKGIYVGDVLTIYNGKRGWWGEGDSKIKVDGRWEFISTGTEDYYGFSYGDFGKFFDSPFLTESRWKGNMKKGYVCLGRTRMLDAINFRNKLEFFTEIWHWKKCKLDMAVSCQWYAINPVGQKISLEELNLPLKSENKSLIDKIKLLLHA